MVTSSISVVCEIVSNLMLTSTIAAKIWWTMRNLEIATGRRYRPSYAHIITVMVESGIIMLVYYTIFAGFLFASGDAQAKWGTTISILSAIMPQILAFAPLLIVVRIGLGRSFEEEHTQNASTTRDTLYSRGRSQALRVRNQLSTSQTTQENDQDPAMDITLRSFQRSHDEESVDGSKVEKL
ncbi:hypothetical protein AAF712_014430 [Marasmius tenuissimus]|uniref:Uncharacterized protein n=1 Tax=Marasmius tenuissimus TaxID=585030 RepID=A0ABR2ZD03_9AGAR